MDYIISVSNKIIIEAICGILYRMAPYNKPRKFNKIIDHIRKYMLDFEDDDHIEKTSNNSNSFIYFDFEDKKYIQPFIKDMLMSCPEFVELNISQKKYDEGERTPGTGYVMIDAYSNDVPDYKDFIDLGAAIGNITSLICTLIDLDDDCFLCKYAKSYESCEHGDYDFCKQCTCNWKEVKNYREPHPWSLLPIGSKEYKDLVAQGKIQGY